MYQNGRYLFTCGLMSDPSFVSKCAFCSQDSKAKKKIDLKGFKLGLPPTEGENIEVNFKVAKKTFSETVVGPKRSSQVGPISGGPAALHNQRSELLFLLCLHFYDFFQQREDKLVCSYSKRIHPQSVPFLRKAL